MLEAKTETMNETKALFENLDKPSLHALSYALRHPDTWPEGFVWDFEDCEQCAMGLAHKLWKSVPKPAYIAREGASMMARHFHLGYEDAKNIFFGEAYRRKHFFGLVEKTVPMSAVTPEMVADAIDKHLATTE